MEAELDRYEHQVIARLHSPYREKFGTPRQPGLAPSVHAELVFEPEFRSAESIRGLEEFSHLWLIFKFHLSEQQGWRPTVRPPRLGGNQRLGVFATRSPFRPNGMGLSVVKIEKIDLTAADGPRICVSGVDIVDQTPIFDIKPYLPYADALDEAVGGFAPTAPDQRLSFSVNASCALGWEQLSESDRAMIEESLSLDPRPAFQKGERIYRLSLGSFELACQIDGQCCELIEIRPSK